MTPREANSSRRPNRSNVLPNLLLVVSVFAVPLGLHLALTDSRSDSKLVTLSSILGSKDNHRRTRTRTRIEEPSSICFNRLYRLVVLLAGVGGKDVLFLSDRGLALPSKVVKPRSPSHRVAGNFVPVVV